MYQHRRERLTALIREQYGSVRKALSDASGWSEARISQILSSTYREGRAFSEKIARKLEGDLSLPAMYFDQGGLGSNTAATAEPVSTLGVEPGFHGAPLRAGETVQPYQAALLPHPDMDTGSAVVLAPAFRRVRPVNAESLGVVQIRRVKLQLSAGIVGFAIEPDEETGSPFNVDDHWIAANRFDPDNLLAIEVTGESMEPRLYKGDLVVVNTGDKQPADGQVFAVNYEGEPVVKRLARDAGHWWLTSDNPDQRRFARKLCDGVSCLIIGRVVLKKSENI